jgi:hypothetical protein
MTINRPQCQICKTREIWMPRLQLPRRRCQIFEALPRRCHVCKILSTATSSPALSACDGEGSGVATRPSALQRLCAHHLRRVCCIPLSSCPPAPAPFFAIVGLGPQRRQQQEGSAPVKAAPLLPLNFRVAWLLFRTLLSSPSAMTVPTKDDSQR